MSDEISFNSYGGVHELNGLKGSIIRSFVIDEQENIWVGTEDEGVSKYCNKSKRFINFSPSSAYYIPTSNIQGLYRRKDEIWCGSFEKGISVISASKNKLLKTYRSKINGGPLSSDFIFCFEQYKDNDILIGTDQGIDLYDAEKDLFRPWHRDQIQGLVTDLLCDSKQRVWVSQKQHLLLRTSENEFYKYEFNLQNDNTITIDPNQVIEDSKNNIWVATNNGLYLFNENKKTMDHYEVSSNEKENSILRIEEDQWNILWLSSKDGLFQFIPESKSIVKYDRQDGLPSTTFNGMASLTDSKKNLYFGTLNGYTSFVPLKPNPNSNSQKLLLTKLVLSSDKGDSCIYFNDSLRKSVISIMPNFNSFKVYYSSLVFSKNQEPEVYYRLENYDSNWRKINSHEQNIEYRNLSPGEYNLQIKYIEPYRRDIASYTESLINIKSYWWKSDAAIILYYCITGGFCLILVLFYRRKNKRKNTAYKEQIKLMAEKEVYNAKIAFFTTIAHEIKTPLSLIKITLERLMSVETPPSFQQPIRLINKNTIRLEELCKQLLDFQRIEINGLKLSFQKTDIKEICNDIFAQFSLLIVNKEIDFKVELPDYKIIAPVDRDAFTKICNNLTSNAIKYCSKKIIITLSIDNSFFYISFFNDGKLIQEKEKSHLFNMFFRGAYNRERDGHGIGLALAKDLAELHNGTLFIEEPSSGMNHFKLKIPLNQDFVFESEYLSEIEEDPIELDINNKLYPHKNVSILIVEDNRELRKYLKDYFSNYYEVYVAHNGKRALQILKKVSISFIITDLIMSEMNGFELCKNIKEDMATSHIPIIILSAQRNISEKIKCLEYGVDDYLEKPFSLKYLHHRVQCTLDNREILYKQFTERPIAFLKNDRTSKKDQYLLDSFSKIIDLNIEMQELNAQLVADRIKIPVGALNKKIKELTQMTTTEYIRQIRLQKAITLLLTEDLRINEVAFRVGFSSSSYFSTCFQKYFGMSPKEYIIKHKCNQQT